VAFPDPSLCRYAQPLPGYAAPLETACQPTPAGHVTTYMHTARRGIARSFRLGRHGHMVVRHGCRRLVRHDFANRPGAGTADAVPAAPGALYTAVRHAAYSAGYRLRVAQALPATPRQICNGLPASTGGYCWIALHHQHGQQQCRQRQRATEEADRPQPDLLADHATKQGTSP